MAKKNIVKQLFRRRRESLTAWVARLQRFPREKLCSLELELLNAATFAALMLGLEDLQLLTTSDGGKTWDNSSFPNIDLIREGCLEGSAIVAQALKDRLAAKSDLTGPDRPMIAAP